MLKPIGGVKQEFELKEINSMTPDKIYFKNRDVAAYRLIDVLPVNKMKLEEWIVLSTSYGGYPVAEIIAKELNGNFDVLFSRKILCATQ
ncbi:MAG: hypothetical protein ACNI22_09700 [Halarcobacter sp.]